MSYVKYMKFQTQKKSTKKIQNQTTKKEDANSDETKLRYTKKISYRCNIKLPRL